MPQIFSRQKFFKNKSWKQLLAGWHLRAPKFDGLFLLKGNTNDGGARRSWRFWEKFNTRFPSFAPRSLGPFLNFFFFMIGAECDRQEIGSLQWMEVARSLRCSTTIFFPPFFSFLPTFSGPYSTIQRAACIVIDGAQKVVASISLNFFLPRFSCFLAVCLVRFLFPSSEATRTGIEER